MPILPPKLSTWRLKNRLWLTLLLLSSVSVIVMVYAILTVSERFEYDVLEQNVKDEVSFLNTLLANDPDAELPHTDHFKTWLDQGTHLHSPKAIHDLPLGETHDFIWHDRHWHIERFDTAHGILTIAIDITQVEATEALLKKLGAGFTAIILLLNLLLAWRLSRRITKPITKLSQTISNLVPGQLEPLAGQYHGLELAQIAAAVDRYQASLIEHIQRERLFTAAASHELRTPLAVMHSSLELLQQQLPSHAADNPALQRALTASLGLQDLVTSLLFLARDQSTQALTTESVCLRDTLQALLAQYDKALSHAGIALSIHWHDENDEPFVNPRINAVPAHLRIVLSNILQNAIQAMQAVQGRQIQASHQLTITLDFSDEYRTVHIDDTGTGLLTNDFASLLGAYVSVDAGRALHKTGLGLHISQKICERYGWQLTGTSKPDDTGSRVSVYFPV